MLKTLMQLLGDDARLFRRYAWMAVLHGLLSGLVVTALVPVLSRLLAGDTRGAAAWLAVLLAGVVLCWAWQRQVEKAGLGLGAAVLRVARHRLGDHVARLPVGWFTPENTARLNHVVSQGMMEVAQLPAHVFTPVFSGAVAPVAVVAALFAMDWRMGLIALLALPLLAGVLLVTAYLGRRADERLQRSMAAASQRMVEFAQAQSVLRAFNGEGGGTRWLEQALGRQRASGAQSIRLVALSGVLNGWAVQAVFAALLVAGALWLDERLGGVAAQGMGMEAAIPVIVALLLACRHVDPLLEVAGYADSLRAARVQLDAVRDILAVQLLPEPAVPQAPRDASVELRDVVFRYAPGQPEVLRGLSLRAEPGSMTALVGASGSGKSSVLRLIARFFDVQQGSVLVGGMDVRQIAGERLAGQISQIFQDSYLFQGSIADNIRMGRPQASDAEVMEAARQAGFVRLPRALPLEPPVPFPEDTLTYLANVYNQKAHDFYIKHGVKVMDAAYESKEEEGEVSLMITKHCVRFSMSLCPKQAKGVIGVKGTIKAEPLQLINGKEKLTLRFDCKPCEMHVVGKMKRAVINQHAKEMQEFPMQFYRTRPVPSASA